jgi:hypothetical protein
MRTSPPSWSAPQAARRHGGLAAAAAFLKGSAALTLDPARVTERALAAAQAKYQAGAFDVALGLVVTAEAAPLDEFQRARAASCAARSRSRPGATATRHRCCSEQPGSLIH